MAAATDSDEARATAREYIDRFVEDTDWTPTRSIALEAIAEQFVTRCGFSLSESAGRAG